MTNIFKTEEKITMRDFLFDTAIEALNREGWTVERVPRSGKASVRRITKNGVSKIVTIRTSQNTWIAFPRLEGADEWRTLEGADYVIASTVDDEHNPKFANVHMIEGDEMRDRFDRAYKARKQHGHKVADGRGVWISLYDKDERDPVLHVGAGAGLAHPPIYRKRIDDGAVAAELPTEASDSRPIAEAPLTIAEAKRRLAATLGVDESAITITVSA